LELQKMKRLILGFAFVLATSITASASVTINYSNAGSLDDGNIVFNGPGTSNVDPVIGRIGGTNFLYGFDSSELLKADANGQARVEAVDGSYVDLSFFSLDGNVFTSAIFNLQVYDPQGQEKPQDGQVTFTIGLVGQPDFIQTFDVSKNGQNFFTILSANGDQINKVSFTTTTQLADLRQLRIGGTTTPGTPEVPEPASMGLMGLGLSGILLLVRKRTSR
jgi:hypothetical protein